MLKTHSKIVNIDYADETILDFYDMYDDIVSIHSIPYKIERKSYDYENRYKTSYVKIIAVYRENKKEC